MKVKPQNGMIQVRKHEPEKLGAIALPENARAERARIEVIAVADGVECCKPGDYIQAGPKTTVIDIHPCLPDDGIMKAEDITCVVEYEPGDDVPANLITKPSLVLPS
jgi:hypothetical protein